jgi:type II secretory pathway component PulF
MQMPSVQKLPITFAAIVGAVLTVILFVFLAVLVIHGPGVPVIAFLVLMYGWIVYVFLRYRQARQTELLHVILASVEAQLPLAPALRAYLRDRPNSALYHFWLGMILHFIVAPYYWVWHRQHDFDRRIAALADELESGATLAQAMNAVPLVASQEMRVAAAVGEATGNLAECLRRADRELTTAAWMELLPRFVYPIFMLVFIFAITTFFMMTVEPKIRVICREFHVKMPAPTERMVYGWNAVKDNAAWIVIGAVGCIAIVVGLIASPSFRWRFPIIGRLYRWDMQSLVLRSLGLLVDMGQPVPKALDLLLEVNDLPSPVKRRLIKAHRLVSNGEPLAVALSTAGLISHSMAALVQSAERTRTLGWAFRELGELLAGKALRVARRLSKIVLPLMVVALGAIVAMVLIGMFIPLIDIIESQT